MSKVELVLGIKSRSAGRKASSRVVILLCCKGGAGQYYFAQKTSSDVISLWIDGGTLLSVIVKCV